MTATAVEAVAPLLGFASLASDTRDRLRAFFADAVTAFEGDDDVVADDTADAAAVGWFVCIRLLQPQVQIPCFGRIFDGSH